MGVHAQQASNQSHQAPSTPSDQGETKWSVLYWVPVYFQIEATYYIEKCPDVAYIGNRVTFT